MTPKRRQVRLRPVRSAGYRRVSCRKAQFEIGRTCTLGRLSSSCAQAYTANRG